MDDLVITVALVIPAAELTFTAVRASGPGGQNVNKVASKVDLRFDLAGSAVLDEAVKTRLRALAGSRLDAEGRIIVTSQATRDQARNLELAREKLRQLVQQALRKPVKRKPTKPSRGAVLRRLEGKHKASAKKQSRGRVRGDE